MKKKYLAVLILCAAAGVFLWCSCRCGIHRKIGSSEYYYYRYGFIDRDKNGLVYDRDAWWYLKDGRVDMEYRGLAENSRGRWRIRNGTVDFSYEGFVCDPGGWWYVSGGKVRENFTGLAYGRVKTDLTGGFYGRNLPGSPALFDADAPGTYAWWYVENGKAVLCDTLVEDHSVWWCVRRGRVWFSYTGIAENENGKFYVGNGRVRFDRDGIFRQQGGTWLLDSGRVTGEIHQDSVRFIAHRGLRSEAPDNTRKAFELAGEAGFWGCETDVRLTADGQFVLLHDQSFRQMCGTDVLPQDLTAEEIRSLSIVKGAHIEDWARDASATEVAFLEEYLQICLQYGMVPVMDMKLKSSGEEAEDFAQMQKLYEAVKSRIGDGEAVFLSSDRNLLKAMRRVLDAAGDSRISLQILIRSADELPLWEYQELGVTPDIKYRGLKEDTIALFRENDLAVNVWTVDDPYKIDFLLKQGTDYITTNKRFW